MENEKIIIDELLEKFTEIASMGWVKSNRSHNTGVGKTFEDLLEKEEDNLGEPDYKGIELKAHRSNSESYVTLFTASPDGPQKSENTRLRNTYGKIDDESNLKILHTSIFANRKNTYCGQYKFQMEVNRNDKKVYLAIYDINDNLLEKISYWEFESLQKKLERKLKKLAFIGSKSKKEDGIELFKYEKITISKFKDFGKFLELIENGNIMLDIRIGVYKSGKNFGKTHDHGTGFRIREKDIELLYDVIESRSFEDEI